MLKCFAVIYSSDGHQLIQSKPTESLEQLGTFLRTLRTFYLCHNAGGTTRCLKICSINTFCCGVDPIFFNHFQIPIHRREHQTALKSSILLHWDGQIFLPVFCQVGPTLHDPVGVAVVWEAHADKHLANNVKS